MNTMKIGKHFIYVIGQRVIRNTKENILFRLEHHLNWQEKRKIQIVHCIIFDH